MTVIVTGAKEIDAVLRGLPKQVNHALMGQAIAAAAKPLIEAEKAGAPKGATHNLVNSIGAVKAPFSRANSLGETMIGPRRHGRFKGHVAHLTETGTRQRAVAGKGKYRSGNRGIMRAKPWAEPAYKQTRDLVRSRINDQVGVKLYAFMKRTLRK